MITPQVARSWFRAAYRAMAANPSTRYGLYDNPPRLVPMETATGEPVLADVQSMTESTMLQRLKDLKK